VLGINRIRNHLVKLAPFSLTERQRIKGSLSIDKLLEFKELGPKEEKRLRGISTQLKDGSYEKAFPKEPQNIVKDLILLEKIVTPPFKQKTILVTTKPDTISDISP